MLLGSGLSGALNEVPLDAFYGTAYRLIEHRDAATALSAVGSLRRGGRYNAAGAFEALYLSTDPITALQTQVVVHTDGRLVGVKGPPRLLLSIECEVRRLLDLSDEAVQSRLEIARRELLAPWVPFVGTGIAAPTQELGAAVYACGRIPALRAPSCVPLRVVISLCSPIDCAAASRSKCLMRRAAFAPRWKEYEYLRGSLNLHDGGGCGAMAEGALRDEA